MKGARGWALLAGLALLAVGIWQVMLLTRAPGEGADPTDWLKFIQEETMYGKSWGARIVALLLAISPVYAFVERAKGGFAVAARGFFIVWMPLALVVALLQTQPVERIRNLYDAAMDVETTAAAATIESQETPPVSTPQQPTADLLNPVKIGMILWSSIVAPVTRVAALLGVLSLSFLVATIHRKARIPALFALLALFAVIAFFWAPTTDAVILILEGLVLGALAFAMPQEIERHGVGRHP